MKYMVPEINISKFSAENIVTLSGTGQANNAVNKALTDAGIASGNQMSVNTTMSDWVNAD